MERSCDHSGDRRASRRVQDRERERDGVVGLGAKRRPQELGGRGHQEEAQPEPEHVPGDEHMADRQRDQGKGRAKRGPGDRRPGREPGADIGQRWPTHRGVGVSQPARNAAIAIPTAPGHAGAPDTALSRDGCDAPRRATQPR